MAAAATASLAALAFPRPTAIPVAASRVPPPGAASPAVAPAVSSAVTPSAPKRTKSAPAASASALRESQIVLIERCTHWLEDLPVLLQDMIATQNAINACGLTAQSASKILAAVKSIDVQSHDLKRIAEALSACILTMELNHHQSPAVVPPPTAQILGALQEALLQLRSSMAWILEKAEALASADSPSNRIVKRHASKYARRQRSLLPALLFAVPSELWLWWGQNYLGDFAALPPTDRWYPLLNAFQSFFADFDIPTEHFVLTDTNKTPAALDSYSCQESRRILADPVAFVRKLDEEKAGREARVLAAMLAASQEAEEDESEEGKAKGKENQENKDSKEKAVGDKEVEGEKVEAEKHAQETEANGAATMTAAVAPEANTKTSMIRVGRGIYYIV